MTFRVRELVTKSFTRTLSDFLEQVTSKDKPSTPHPGFYHVNISRRSFGYGDQVLGMTHRSEDRSYSVTKELDGSGGVVKV